MNICSVAPVRQSHPLSGVQHMPYYPHGNGSNTPTPIAGMVLFPHGLEPQLHVIPRSAVEAPSLGHGLGGRHTKAGNHHTDRNHRVDNKFHFFHPVRKEHPTTRFVLDELSPLRIQNNAPVAVDIPMESILSIIPQPTTDPKQARPPPPPRHLSDARRRDAREDAEADGGEVANVPQSSAGNNDGDNGAIAFSQWSPDRKGHGAPPEKRTRRSYDRKNRRTASVSPSVESQQHAAYFNRVQVECKEVENAHMAVRRRRKVDRRSHEHYELMHQRQAEDWKRVCDSTAVLEDDRHAIHALYDARIVKVPQLPVGDGARVGQHTKKSRLAVASSGANSPTPPATYDTESSVLLSLETLPRLEIHQRPRPAPTVRRDSPLRSALPPIVDPRQHASPTTIGGPSIVARKSTQDVIAAMERRYQLEMEKEAKRAEKQCDLEERNKRRADELLLEARHVVHQHLSKERRRDEARRKADELESLKRENIRERLQERDMNTQYNQWRAGVGAMGGGGGVLQGFHAIAKRNEDTFLR